MEDNQNIPTSPDFSDIPALDDTQGLEAYLNNQALAASGVTVQPTVVTQPSTDSAAQQPAQQNVQPTAPATVPTSNPGNPAVTPNANGNVGDTITLTKEQLAAILASRGQAPAQPQPTPAPQARSAGYTVQEQQFISKALSQGYSLEQINNFLIRQRGSTNDNSDAMQQRIARVEQYLKDQEYKAAETAFISKLSDFGNKWGLSEQDLVTFGNEALKQGINIATGNVNLETVFRAVYPDQYAIRSRRMTPTNSSQIYGGTSIPEGNRAATSKLEDAYVENFLKGAMPNQYGMLNKK